MINLQCFQTILPAQKTFSEMPETHQSSAIIVRLLGPHLLKSVYSKCLASCGSVDFYILLGVASLFTDFCVFHNFAPAYSMERSQGRKSPDEVSAVDHILEPGSSKQVYRFGESMMYLLLGSLFHLSVSESYHTMQVNPSTTSFTKYPNTTILLQHILLSL